jgi:hypothetical protein
MGTIKNLRYTSIIRNPDPSVFWGHKGREQFIQFGGCNTMSAEVVFFKKSIVKC